MSDIELGTEILSLVRSAKRLYPEMLKSCPLPAQTAPYGTHVLWNIGPMIGAMLIASDTGIPRSAEGLPGLQRGELHKNQLDRDDNGRLVMRKWLDWHLKYGEIASMVTLHPRGEGLNPLLLLGSDPVSGNPLVIAIDRICPPSLRRDRHPEDEGYCALNTYFGSSQRFVDHPSIPYRPTPVWRPEYTWQRDDEFIGQLDAVCHAVRSNEKLSPFVMWAIRAGRSSHITMSAAMNYRRVLVSESDRGGYDIQLNRAPFKSPKPEVIHSEWVPSITHVVDAIIGYQDMEPDDLYQHWFALKNSRGETIYGLGTPGAFADLVFTLNESPSGCQVEAFGASRSVVEDNNSLKRFNIADFAQEPQRVLELF